MVTLITFDVDWAPDFVLDDVAEILNENEVKATWFFTHKSDVIKKFRKNKNFELGIHPNFLPHSTQGSNPKGILTNLKKIVPESVSIRTHSLYQSTPILSMYKNFGLQNDVSLFLFKTRNLEPHFNPALELYRIPYFWEDDCEMYYKRPNWSIHETKHMKGLKIYNFHPIHVSLNSKNLNNYHRLKNKKGLCNVSKNTIKNYVDNGKGTRTFLLELIDYIKSKENLLIKDIKSIYCKITR